MADDIFDTTTSEQSSMDENFEPNDQNDLHEMSETFGDLLEEESFESSFADKIDNLSLDELKTEREKLIEMGALNGEEIARQYDTFMEAQRKSEDFNYLIDDLSLEQLQQLKGNLIEGNEETFKLLGLNDVEEDDSSDNNAKTLRLNNSYDE